MNILLFLLLNFSTNHFERNVDTINQSLNLPTLNLDTEAVGDQDFIISKYTVDVTFEKNKKDEVFVIYKTNMTIQSQTYIPQKFVYPMFLDNQTSFDNVRKKTNKKDKKIKLVESDYEQNGIFHSDLKITYLEHEFSEYGEEVHFEFEKVFYDLKFLEPIYLKLPYETNNIEINVTSPEWANMEIREFNFDGYNINKSKNSPKTYKINCQKIAQPKISDLSPPRSFYEPHIILIPQHIKTSNATNSYISNTKDLYDWYYSLVKSVDNKSSSFKSTVLELTENVSTDKEKIRNIFYWVQDNIRYIAFEYDIMGFKPENCQNVFSNGYGDCKGMANLTKEMLKNAGYDARLAWIGTNSIPYDYSLPSIVVDNHMICSVIIENDTLYLDATEKSIELDYYADRIKGRPVLIEDGDNYILSKIPKSSPFKYLNSVEENYKIVESDLEIKGILSLSGTEKTNMLQLLSSIPQNRWEDYFKNHINSFQDSKIEIHLDSLQAKRDVDFNLPYDITVNNEVIELDDEIYFQLDHDKYFSNIEIEDDRTLPIYLNKEYGFFKRTVLEIPNGYEVNYLPQSIDIDTKNYVFKFNVTKNADHKIHYTRIIKTKTNFITKEDFDEFIIHLKALNQFYDDQIILTKI